MKFGNSKRQINRFVEREREKCVWSNFTKELFVLEIALVC